MRLAIHVREPERLRLQPLGHRLRPVEPEDVARLGDGIEAVGEARLDPGALVEEWERAHRRRDARGEPGAVLLALELDAREGGPRLLRLDHADGVPVHVEQVVGEAVPRRQRHLAHRHAATRREVQRGDVLDHPAGIGEGAVDLFAGEGFGGGQRRRGERG